MLIASKNNLETNLRVKIMQLRGRELDYFLRNAYNVGNLAALLVGFAQSGLVYTKYIDNDLCGLGELLCSELIYPISIAIALGFSISAVWGSVLLSTHAPRVAIHGEHSEAYSRCVDAMEKEFHLILQQLTLGVVAFCFSASLWAFSKWGTIPKTSHSEQIKRSHHSLSSAHIVQRPVVHHLPTVLLIAFILLGTLYLMSVVNTYYSRYVFRIPRNQLVRGKVNYRNDRRRKSANSSARARQYIATPAKNWWRADAGLTYEQLATDIDVNLHVT